MTLPSSPGSIKPEMENLHIDAIDQSGFLASVDITLTNRWRQVHGISDRAQMVEIALYGSVTIRLPDGSPDYKPSFQIELPTAELAALQDPGRCTFVNLYGHVVEMSSDNWGHA